MIPINNSVRNNSFVVDETYRIVCAKLFTIKKRLDELNSGDTIDDIYNDFCNIQEVYQETIEKNSYFKEFVNKIAYVIGMYFETNL